MTHSERLTSLGWDEGWQKAFDRAPGLEPARVVAEHRGRFDIVTASGDLYATLTGKMSFDALSREELPTVGDWVAVLPSDDGSSTIQQVMPRRSSFVRKLAGQDADAQVVAANVDVVFVLEPFDRGPNLRRLERYLTVAWASGATPVVILAKVDLRDDVSEILAEVKAVASGTDVHAVSCVTGTGVDALHAYTTGGRTVALLGSSGAGKSSLVNALMGEEVMATSEVREDGKGRHTTTHRQLISLPDGGSLIDTPGMRELQLWEGDTGIDVTFDDIAELAQGCRFNDCSHSVEPKCAVLGAVESGELPAERLESYRKQLRELAAIARKKDRALASAEAKKSRKLYQDASRRARQR